MSQDVTACQGPNLQVIAHKMRLMSMQMTEVIPHCSVEVPCNYSFIHLFSHPLYNTTATNSCFYLFVLRKV